MDVYVKNNVGLIRDLSQLVRAEFGLVKRSMTIYTFISKFWRVIRIGLPFPDLLG